jgi:hypothetical protein
MCHVALAYPNTLQTVARIFSTYARVGYPINKIRLERMINAVIQRHAPLGHHSEVAWALWICKDIEIKPSIENIDLLSEIHSSICALMLLDLFQSGKLSKAPKLNYWKQFENVEALHGDLWLLSYEAGSRGWANFTETHILADKYFNLFKAQGINFYNPNATLQPIFHVKTSALEIHNIYEIADLFDKEDIDDLIEYEESDGGYEGVIFENNEFSYEEEPEEDESDEEEDLF